MSEPHRPPLLPLLSRNDLEYLRSFGKSESDVAGELRALSCGIPPVRLRRACTPGDGVVRLNQAEEERLARAFDPHVERGRTLKFVAASGAASRMFRAHLTYAGKGELLREDLVRRMTAGEAEAGELLQFFDNLNRFPFVSALESVLSARGSSLEALLAQGCYGGILDALLGPAGLGYADAPKGLIPFHRYPEGIRTAFEEHLVEAIGYMRDREGNVNLHFTVPAGEEGRVGEHLKKAAARFSGKGTEFQIGLSSQHRASDTIALDPESQPVRDDDGRILLWPAGHGTLLENLNALRGDIVFVRTIDNALPDRLKSFVAFYKRVLGGLMVTIEQEIRQAVEMLESCLFREANLRRLEEWGRESLGLRPAPAGSDRTVDERGRELARLLCRPLRVCAMVRHEGEPGGGPFWVERQDGTESLQIVEAAQVDRDSPEQREIWQSSAYFNPADIVCGLRDGHGRQFDLSAYVDRSAGFISGKQYKAKRIRILERPGLWNGGMAFWNTVFVEVPKATLHPVKSVLDLLSPEHRI